MKQNINDGLSLLDDAQNIDLTVALLEANSVLPAGILNLSVYVVTARASQEGDCRCHLEAQLNEHRHKHLLTGATVEQVVGALRALTNLPR